MVRSELILRVAARHKHLVQKDAEIAVDLIIDAIAKALSNGRRVELREFASFQLRLRKARKARNPKTGAAVMKPEKYSVYFRATGDLKRRVNAGMQRSIDSK